MNKSFICAIVFVISLFCTAEQANANNAGGGDLTYEWLTDSTYRFYFRLSRYCAGNPEPASVTMCVRNTCNTVSFTRTLVLLPMSAIPLPAPYCTGYKTNCDSAASTIPGFKTVWYTDTCTLPSRCDYWSFSVAIPGRPAGNTILNAGTTDMCIDATLNNTGNNQGNSSPYFAVPAFPFACKDQLLLYNNIAIDPDGDSLVTEVAYPQDVNGACPAGPVNVAFAPAVPFLSIPLNPISTSSIFNLNSATGQFSFTSPQLGTHTLALRVHEYKNGVRKGTVMREVSFSTLTCQPPIPALAVTNIPFANPYQPLVLHIAYPSVGYTACAKTFSFRFAVLAPNNTNANLVVSDNHQTEMPGSNIVYTNLNTDSVVGTFTWTPTASQAGSKVLSLTVSEAGCLFPGIEATKIMNIPVTVLPVPASTVSIKASTGVNIWPGLKVWFTATADCIGKYQWIKNGIPIHGANSDMWGTTDLKDQDAIACSMTCHSDCASPKSATSNTLIMQVATGIKETKDIEQLHIYPNPNKGQFTIGGTALLNMDKLDIEVWSSVGQLVYKKTVSKTSTTSDLEIMLPDMMSGVYQLSIRTTAGTRSTPFTVID